MARSRSEKSGSEQEQQPGAGTRLLYRPWALAGSVTAGIVAGKVTDRVWRHVEAADGDKPPSALQSEVSLRQVLLAAAFQGMVFAVVKAAMQRGTARGFQRWTGEWPGSS